METSTLATITNALPPKYLEHRENVLEAGKNILSAATTFAMTLVHAHKDLGDDVWQLIADVAPKLDVKEKTLKNYLGTLENALEQGWHVPALSISHHTSVDSPKLEPGDKETLLTTALQEDLSVGETRELCRSYMEERGLIKQREPADRDDPLFELNEEIERLNGRVDEARDLISDALPHVKEANDTELDMRIGVWLLAE